jgi:hypothetical protein
MISKKMMRQNLTYGNLSLINNLLLINLNMPDMFDTVVAMFDEREITKKE